MDEGRAAGWEAEEISNNVPLLEPRATPPADDELAGAGGEGMRFGRRLLEENRKLWVVAAPSIFAGCSTFGLNIISQAFIGHVGPTELAAYALVSTVVIRFSYGIIVRAN